MVKKDELKRTMERFALNLGTMARRVRSAGASSAARNGRVNAAIRSNVVVSHNIGRYGGSREASARQTTSIRQMPEGVAETTTTIRQTPEGVTEQRSEQAGPEDQLEEGGAS